MGNPGKPERVGNGVHQRIFVQKKPDIGLCVVLGGPGWVLKTFRPCAFPPFPGTCRIGPASPYVQTSLQAFGGKLIVRRHMGRWATSHRLHPHHLNVAPFVVVGEAQPDLEAQLVHAGLLHLEAADHTGVVSGLAWLGPHRGQPPSNEAENPRDGPRCLPMG